MQLDMTEVYQLRSILIYHGVHNFLEENQRCFTVTPLRYKSF